MSFLHRILEPRLSPVVASAEFELADRSGSGSHDVNQVAWLEYRAEYADRRVLLDIYQAVAQRTVNATLWSPADLARADPEAGVHAIAIHERTWRYDASADWDALADELVAEVAAWLEQAPRAEMIS